MSPAISFGSLVLGLIALVGIFITALAWNDAITSSINRGLLQEDGKFEGDVLTAKWIYAIVATIVLLLVLWWLTARSKKGIESLLGGLKGDYVVQGEYHAQTPMM